MNTAKYLNFECGGFDMAELIKLAKMAGACMRQITLTLSGEPVDFISKSRLSYFRVLTICLLFVYFVSAAVCHCFDLSMEDCCCHQFKIISEIMFSVSAISKTFPFTCLCNTV